MAVARPLYPQMLVPGHTTPIRRRPPLAVTPTRRGRAIVLKAAPVNASATSGGDQAAYGFQARVYLAFDSAQTALPNWLEVTPWVDLERAPIRITRGRSDGLSDTQPGTCAMTVKNIDYRFTPKNSNGPWAGLFGKYNWLRVDLTPPSGNTSTRYVGFLIDIVTSADGLEPYTQLSATDRFGMMQNAPNYLSMPGNEILADALYQVPSSGATLQAYYPLHEPQGAATLGDQSGQVNPALTPVPVGSVTAGTGLNLANTQGPGADAVSTVNFTPPTATAGTVLTTTVPSLQSAGSSVFALECWLKTTEGSGAPNNHTFMSLSDLTTTPYVFALFVDTSGYLGFGDTYPYPNGVPSDGGNVLVINNGVSGLLAPAPILNDGNWHHVFVWVRRIPPSQAAFLIAIDGVAIYGPPFIYNIAIPATLTTLHVGGALSGVTKGLIDPFNGALSDVAYYTLGVNFYGLPTPMPNFPQHARAGLTGFAGESADARVARLARYAGAPQPITPTTVVPASTGFPVQVWTNQTGTLGQWVDMQPAAHPCGTQAIAGAQPVTSIREAAHTENMPVHVSRQGNITMRPNTSRWNLTAAWSVHALDLENTPRFPDDQSYLANQATITPNGQASQTVNGPAGLASQAKTGVLVNTPLSTASYSVAEAQSLGTDITNRQSDPAPRPDQLVIIANTLASAPWTPVPPSMGVSSDSGYAILLHQIPDAYQGAQVYEIVVPAGSPVGSTVLDVRSIATSAGLSYSGQVQLRVTTPGQNPKFNARLDWLNAAGTVTATSLGSNATITGGATGYTQVVEAHASPGGTVAANLRIALGSVPTADITVQIDGIQYEQAAAPTAFQVPGPGSPNLLTVDQATAGEGSGFSGTTWYDAVLASEVSTPLQVVGWPGWRPDAATGVQLLEGYTEEIALGTHTLTLSTSYLDPHVFTLDSTDALDGTVPIGY